MGSVPKQVREQADRANEIHNQVYNPEDTPDDDADDQGQGHDEPQIDDVDPQLKQPPVDDSGDADAPDVPTAPKDPPAAKDDEPTESWEQRYRTAQGLLKAESQRWAAERRELQVEIEDLKKAVAKPAEKQPAKDPAKPLVTDADLETYGPELLDVIGRKAQEMAAQIVDARMAELKPELESTKKQVTDIAQQSYKTNEDKFYGELERSVPDWKAINTDQNWLAWLGEVDPLSGVPRQRYLDNAAQQLDHAHVARLFNAYKESAGIETPKKESPAAKPAHRKPEISPSPRAVGNATAPTHREPQVGVSRSEIDAHYRRSTLEPQYRHSEEHKAMEQRIATAMAANQIT